MNLKRHEKRSTCDAVCFEAHEHNILQQTFQNLSEALEYLTCSKLDTVFTTRTSNEKTQRRQYNCRQNEADKVKKPKPKLYKTYGSNSVKSVPCKAGFTIQKLALCHCPKLEHKSKECHSRKEVFLMKGCLTHGHDVECRNKRLSPLVKAFILEKLNAGVSIEKILELHFTKSVSMDSQEKPVTYTDIVNIARFNGVGGIDPTASERQNCLDLMENSGYVGFNWEKVLGPSVLTQTLSDKLVETNETLCIIYMDQKMRERFRRYPYRLCLDSTHGTNKSKYLLVSILVYGKINL